MMTTVYALWAINWWNTATAGFDGWGVGEWLLSYSGGYVRRGLFGALVLAISPDHVSLVYVVAAIQVVLMGALFGVFYALYLRTDRSLAWAMVIMSPAVLLYPTIVFTHQLAGPRKELLVLLALGAVALGYGRPNWFWWAMGGLVPFSLATWSHEASALLLPAFFYLLWTGGNAMPSTRRRNALIAGYGLVGGLALVLSMIYPGNAEIQQQICSAWAERGVVAACDQQALGALTLTMQTSLDLFRTALFPRYWEYLPVAVLAIVPLYAVRFLPRCWRVTLVVLLAMVPLFYIAWDYGRWIVIAASTLSILALAVASDERAPKPMAVPLIAVLAYCLLWGFPGYSNEPPVMYDGWAVTWLKEHAPAAWYGPLP